MIIFKLRRWLERMPVQGMFRSLRGTDSEISCLLQEPWGAGDQQSSNATPLLITPLRLLGPFVRPTPSLNCQYRALSQHMRPSTLGRKAGWQLSGAMVGIGT